MSRRKAFHAGEDMFVIEENCGQEMYIGSATIDTLPEELKVKPRPRSSGVLLIALFSAAAIATGLIVAAVWR